MSSNTSLFTFKVNNWLTNKHDLDKKKRKAGFSLLRPLSNFNCLLTFQSAVKRMPKITWSVSDWQAKSIHKIWYYIIFSRISSYNSRSFLMKDEVAVVRWPAPYTSERKQYLSSSELTSSSFTLESVTVTVTVTFFLDVSNPSCIMVKMIRSYQKSKYDTGDWRAHCMYNVGIMFEMISY